MDQKTRSTKYRSLGLGLGLGAALALMGCSAQAVDNHPADVPEEDRGMNDPDHAHPHIVDKKSIAKAIIDRDKLPAARLIAEAPEGALDPFALFPFWQYLGPTSFHQSSNPNGFNDTQSGRINTVAFDPQHNGTWYAGAPWGGVWKTTDFGGHWAPLSDKWPYLQVSSIAVDPHNGNVLYAGTGDFQGGSAYTIGVMKSIDGGATWTSSGLSNNTIPKVLVDPDDSNIVIAATSWGLVYRSTDAGATWNPVINVGTDWEDLAFSPPNFFFPRHWYAIGRANGGLIYRSDDHGATWTQLTSPFTASMYQYGLRIATSPIHPDNVYAIAMTDKKLAVSHDAGATWSNIAGNLTSDDWFWSQTGYNTALAVSSVGDASLGGSGQDVIWAAGPDLYRNIGGDTTWTSINAGHADNHALAVNPFDRNSLLLGNDGGVYNLTYQPTLGTTTTFSVNQTLGVTEFMDASFSVSDPDWILGGTQDTGTAMSSDMLGNWIQPGGGDGGGGGINPLNKSWMYLTWNWGFDQRTMLRTDNAWQTAQNITPSTNSEPGAWSAKVTIDPSQPWKMYAATNYLYKYDENTHAWTNHLGGQKLSATGNVQVITVSDADFNRIYTAANDGNVWMTTDGGSTWKQIDTGQVTGQNVTSVSVNPQNANDVLVGLWRDDGRSHLWRTTNPLANPVVWTDASAQGSGQGLPQLPVLSIAREPSAPATGFYAGTDVGVFYTDDAGAHWYNATAPLGLPNVPVSQLKAVPQTGYLYAVTYGRGIWRARLGCQARTCASAGANCDTISDGCGGTRQCGSCSGAETCGGGGTPNVCGVCTPTTCQAGMCGTMGNGCGGTITCGGCSGTDVCFQHECTPRMCVPRHCAVGFWWNPDDCRCERGLPQ